MTYCNYCHHVLPEATKLEELSATNWKEGVGCVYCKAVFVATVEVVGKPKRSAEEIEHIRNRNT